MLTFKTPADIPYEEWNPMTSDEFAKRFTHKNITLTAEDANLLVCYLIMTTQHRRGEADAWAKLAEEQDENGKPTFPNAQSNAEWWESACARLENIKRIIDDSPRIEQPKKIFESGYISTLSMAIGITKLERSKQNED